VIKIHRNTYHCLTKTAFYAGLVAFYAWSRLQQSFKSNSESSAIELLNDKSCNKHLFSVWYFPLGSTVRLVNDLLQLVCLFRPVQTQRISQQPYTTPPYTSSSSSHGIFRMA